MTESVIKKIRQKIGTYKKEDYIVLLLVGVLLVIIFLPSEKDKGTGDSRFKETDAILENQGNTEYVDNTLGSLGGEEEEGQDQPDALSADVELYIRGLEKRMENILSQMAGAGEVQVMITAADCGQTVLERDAESASSVLEETDASGGTRKNTERQIREEVVYTIDREGKKIPYVAQKRLPKINGVVVLAQGAGNVEVKENIIEAVSVLFQVNEHRIKVIKMKS